MLRRLVQRLLHHIRFVALGCILLQSVAARSIDTCYKYHKRAPVKSVCGRIQDISGARPDGLKLTLVTLNDTVLSTAEIDHNGRFIFGPVPKGDYLLRATAPGYLTLERQLRITRDQYKSCKPRIEMTLGFRSCDGGTYVRGFDKKSDLFQ